ncbi:uncharacterized protein [Apostichopus japonicus]|uniref:uncharacterized protein n=1 Tax=Stichopus japonicus TaxID=307972 RepID=UPI003AB2266F
MIRRGCEDALAGNRACLTAEDFLVRPTIVPFDVSSTEVNGRACFCDGNRCNENINQNNIENLVFLVQSEGLSDKVSLTWNILPTDVEIDGFLVQVKLIGLNEWITVSSLLSPEEREFIIEGVISADVREIRVIAVDQSKIAVMTSLTVPVRKIASGMRSHRTLSRGMIGIIVVIIVIILILMVVLLVAWKIRRSSLARCKEAALPY